MDAKLNERCEWNPVLRTNSLDPPRDTDCLNETWWSIGHGDQNFHVCDSCARLPEFYLRKKRDPINANPALKESSSPSYTLKEIEIAASEYLDSKAVDRFRESGQDLTPELLISNLIAYLARREREGRDV